MHRLRFLPLIGLFLFIGAAPWDGEEVQQWTTESQVRVLLNEPASIDPSKATQLIIFALPNGNTIEQTLGCKLAPGMDLSLIHISEPTRLLSISYAVFCLKKKKR